MFNIMFNDSEKLVVNSKNKMKKLRFFLNILNMQLKVKIYFLNSEQNKYERKKHKILVNKISKYL